MDRNGVLAVILLFLLASNGSDAIRRLDEAQKVNNTTAKQQVSPLPNSSPSDVNPDPKPKDGIKSDENDKKKIEGHKIPDISSLVDSLIPQNSSVVVSQVATNSSSQTPESSNVVASQVATTSSVVDSQTPKSSNVVDSQVATNSSVVDSQTPKSSNVDDSQAATNSSVVNSQTPKSSNVVDSQAPTNSSAVDPKGLNNTSSVIPSPTAQNDTSSVTPQPAVKETDDEQPDQKANKDVDKGSPEEKIPESCDGLPNRCNDGGSLEACIQNFESGSKDLIILVKNKGEKTLKVSLAVPAYVQSSLKELEIPKHQAEKINISIDISKSSNIIFNAGSSECKLHVEPVSSEPDFFLRLPSFENLATPVNGAYLLILAGIVLGLTWACFKCRKTKRHDDGIPYQELEMGLQESVSATSGETAEGWDQGWDDDWDDDRAVKSPAGGRTVGSVSANGLTARSGSKDGWDNDWDD